MTKKIYERLTRSFQNSTKLSIMLLLTQKGNMTVTQMSKYVGVTKASLYHSIFELVNDGLVSEPEVRVKKSYLEKYYRLNTLAFRAIDPYELQKRLNHGANSAEYKDLLEAFFNSFSIYFGICAQEIRMASKERLQQIAEELKDERMLLWAFDLKDEDYNHGLNEIRELLEKCTAKEKVKSENADRRPEHFGALNNRIFIVTLPRSLTHSAS